MVTDLSNATYEYGILTVGVAQVPGPPGKLQRHLTFRQFESLLGKDLDVDFSGSYLEALNLAGAQGWQVVRQYEHLARKDDLWLSSAIAVNVGTRDGAELEEWQVSSYSQFLMMRTVRD